MTVGRRLDFQLASARRRCSARRASCASPTAPPNCATTGAARSRSSRPPADALEAILAAAGDRAPAVDRDWVARAARQAPGARRASCARSMETAPAGSDGRCIRTALLAALRRRAAGRRGRGRRRRRLPQLRARRPAGDAPSSTRARSAASASARRSASPPAWRCPDRTVVVATGDGAFGFNAMEIDTAVRHKAPVLIVVANNGAWAIEVRDQQETHGKVVGTAAAVRRPRGDGARLRHACRARRARRGPRRRDRARAREPAGAARRGGHAGGGLVRREVRAWPGCPTCSRWRPGTRPSGAGARARTGRPPDCQIVDRWSREAGRVRTRPPRARGALMRRRAERCAHRPLQSAAWVGVATLVRGAHAARRRAARRHNAPAPRRFPACRRRLVHVFRRRHLRRIRLARRRRADEARRDRSCRRCPSIFATCG